MGLLDSVRVPRDRTYSGYHFARFPFSTTGLSPALADRSRSVRLASTFTLLWPQQPHPTGAGWFGLFPFRSPLLGKSLLLSFPTVTEMFQFTALAPYAYIFSVR